MESLVYAKNYVFFSALYSKKGAPSAVGSRLHRIWGRVQICALVC
jgi:hypothetical protein